MDSTSLSNRLAKLQSRVEDITGQLCEFIMFKDAGLWHVTILTQSFKLFSSSKKELDMAVESLESFAFSDDFPEKIQELNTGVEGPIDAKFEDFIGPATTDKRFLN
jgi:hypothetical protein